MDLEIGVYWLNELEKPEAVDLEIGASWLSDLEEPSSHVRWEAQ